MKSTTITMNNHLLSLPFCVVAILLIGSTQCDPKFGGENVCNKTVTIRRDKTVEEPIEYKLKYDGLCGIIPCTKTRTVIRTDSKIKESYEEIQVPTCCPGYAEAPDRKCKPICLNSCNNGRCVAPNVCQCNPEPTETSPGFLGSHCSRFSCLRSDRWGSKCDHVCDCPPNSYCSGSTGKCLCYDGWRGANCTEECDPTTCAGFELPPIIEPDANIIHDSLLGSSQKLEALAPERIALERYSDENDPLPSSSVASLAATHIGINLFLIMLTLMLIFAVVFYRGRLNELKNQIYYRSAYSSSTRSSEGSSSANYCSPSTYSDANFHHQNRPRMPTPMEADFLGKNLSFQSATRFLIKGGGDPQPGEKSVKLDKFVVDPKVEAHLIKSQKSSKQNIYSDIESNFTNSERSFNLGGVQNSALMNQSLSESRLLRVDVTNNSDENAYQVPKSSCENEECLYEEIAPRSPSDQSK